MKSNTFLHRSLFFIYSKHTGVYVYIKFLIVLKPSVLVFLILQYIYWKIIKTATQKASPVWFFLSTTENT